MGGGTPDTGHCRLTGEFIRAVVKTVPAPPSILGGTEKILIITLILHGIHKIMKLIIIKLNKKVGLNKINSRKQEFWKGGTFLFKVAMQFLI